MKSLGKRCCGLLQFAAKLGTVAVISVTLYSFAEAADITAFVDGRSGPWNITPNPSFSYGVVSGGVPDQHLAPTAISSASGLPFVTGDILTVQYISGSPLAGSGGTLFGVGGNGVASWPIAPPCTDSPGCYTGVTTYLEQLLGVYANAGGVIVGQPFILGSGPTSVTIPAGASQLLLGFNDGWYNDNGAGINVRITESVPEPGSTAMMLIGLVVLLLSSRRDDKLV